MDRLLKLDRHFYANANCAEVAQLLLGKILVVHRPGQIKRMARIVETEAYLGPQDLAAHSSKGVTARTQIMFGDHGYVYVYLIYGMHHCMNIVCGPVGSGSAVLLRAVEPIVGIDLATNGPGRLCKALGVDRNDYGQDLCGDQIYLLDGGLSDGEHIGQSARIGVEYAKEWALKPLRFYIENNAFVSKIRKKSHPKGG